MTALLKMIIGAQESKKKPLTVNKTHLYISIKIFNLITQKHSIIIEVRNPNFHASITTTKYFITPIYNTNYTPKHGKLNN